VLAQQEFNQAFVLMEYFGYLKRDANTDQTQTSQVTTSGWAS